MTEVRLRSSGINGCNARFPHDFGLFAGNSTPTNALFWFRHMTSTFCRLLAAASSPAHGRVELAEGRDVENRNDRGGQ